MKELLKNSSKHLITTIIGLVIMFIGITFYSVAWLKLIDNTFTIWQLSGTIGVGLVLIFSPDNLIPILLNGIKNIVTKKTL